MTTSFSPPPYCFTSGWATNPQLEGLVYVTVGCPAIDVTTVPSSLSACCGPFSDMSGLLIATLPGCPEGYGPTSSYIATGLGKYDFSEFWCCPTAYGWSGKCALSATNAFKPGGPSTVTITFANVLYATWDGTAAVAASTTPGELSQSSSASPGTQQTLTSMAAATQLSSISSLSINPTGGATTNLQPLSSTFPKRDIPAVVVPVVVFLLIVGAFVVYFLRKRRAVGGTTVTVAATSPNGPKRTSIELAGSPIQELHSESRPLELYSPLPKD